MEENKDINETVVEEKTATEETTPEKKKKGLFGWIKNLFKKKDKKAITIPDIIRIIAITY